MKSETVEIRTTDGPANAYLARPDGGAHPGVLFISDAYGLRSTMSSMAGRAPVDALLGPSKGPRPASAFRAVLPLIQELTPARIIGDGGAYLEYLESLAAPGPVAVTGFCMGGRLAWRIAAAYPGRVAALAAFHTAGLVTDTPDSPHRSAADLGPVEAYFGFADQDQGMTPEQIATLEQALESAGVRYVAEIYEGAGHGYAVADSQAYDEAAAERQADELRALLARTLRQVRRPAGRHGDDVTPAKGDP